MANPGAILLLLSSIAISTFSYAVPTIQGEGEISAEELETILNSTVNPTNAFLAGGQLPPGSEEDVDRFQLKYSPDKKFLYVLDVRGKDILRYNVSATDQPPTAKRIGCRVPNDFEFNQDGTKIFVTCPDSESVLVYDLPDFTNETEILLDIQPHSIALSANDQYMYCCEGEDGCRIVEYEFPQSKEAPIDSGIQRLLVNPKEVWSEWYVPKVHISRGELFFGETELDGCALRKVSIGSMQRDRAKEDGFSTCEGDFATPSADTYEYPERSPVSGTLSVNGENVDVVFFAGVAFDRKDLTREIATFQNILIDGTTEEVLDASNRLVLTQSGVYSSDFDFETKGGKRHQKRWEKGRVLKQREIMEFDEPIYDWAKISPDGKSVFVFDPSQILEGKAGIKKIAVKR